MSHAGHNTELDCQCGDCKLRYPKFYHQHIWDSFRNMDRKDVRFIDGQKFTRTIDAQEMICKKYNVTLLYYRTKWQRRFDKVEHIVNVIKSGLSRFKRGLDKLHEQFHNPNFHSFKDGSKRNVKLGKVEWGLIGE